MTRFQGKVALISAAGAGIGRATAMIIAREGGTVVGVDLEPALLDRLTADVIAAGGRALAVRADALDAASVEGAVRQAVRRLRAHRHPGQRRGRQHRDRRPAARWTSSRSRTGRSCIALQPDRHVPLHATR